MLWCSMSLNLEVSRHHFRFPNISQRQAIHVPIDPYGYLDGETPHLQP